ncbi:phosphatase 2C-like domain-containing protein [Lentinula detonsa]|uniref:Phosphatase 2C-like domain-containing protein n=1 Tax=Lentinula detonsa TaxID=2804962 RepID=A0AA38PSE9_9AGAR|nr:phosphatase 2C-like domain-containing protein [Lentinula detonsa]
MFSSHASGHPDPNLEDLARSFIRKSTFSNARMTNETSTVYAQFRGTPNEDRFTVSEDWELSDHVWQFIAVFDGNFLTANISSSSQVVVTGHGGSTTADYLAKHFTSHLRRSMELSFSYSPESTPSPNPPVLQLLSTARPRSNDTPVILFTNKNISEFLKRQVRAFDEDLGKAVKEICPNPESLSDKEAHALYEAHKMVIARARCGSTMAGILLDKTERRMWVCCVGDSSVVLSTKSPISDRRKAVLLNQHHTAQSPQEYHRVTMAHPSHERDKIWLDGEERIFGTLSMTRAFGDFMYKFPTSFTATLFSKFPSTAMRSVNRVLSYNRTPPYVISDPFVTFVDLTAFSEDEDPAVIIYSDGLEALASRLSIAAMNKGISDVSGSSDAVPTAVDIIGAFLGQPLDLAALPSSLTDIFPNNNAAFNLISNLLDRAIPKKLRAHLESMRNDDGNDDEELYIDDVTVIVFKLFTAP